jgi:hypothetical protein
MASVLHRCRIPEHDEDHDLFRLISSETDHLPFGPVRDLWAREALERLGPEMLGAEAFYRELVFAACNRLRSRFVAPN